MRRLLPAPAVDEVDEDAAYWVPDPGRQHVRGVMVASADGASQLDGHAARLSGPADARLLAMLRGHADVILAGARTVRVDHYGQERPSPERRAWRLARGLPEAPRTAVVTRSCALDPDGPLFTGTTTRPLVITCTDAPAERLAALAGLADVVLAGEHRVDLGAALDALAARGLRRVSCEGGPLLLAGVAAAGRLDELSVTVSPQLVGGAAIRILQGAPLEPPLRLELGHVLEEDGFLFLRYLRRPAGLPAAPGAAGGPA